MDGHQPGPRRRAPRRPRGGSAGRCPRWRACAATCRCRSATRSTTRSTSTRRCARLRRSCAPSSGRASDELTDEGGLVEPETLRRVGLADHGATGLSPQDRVISEPGEALPGVSPLDDHVRRPPRVPERVAAGAGRRRPRARRACSRSARTPPSRRSPRRGSPRSRRPLLPRVGWLLRVIGLCGWLVSPEADRQGTALVLAAAAAPIPFLLPRAGLLWSVPMLAPLLGTIALAPAFIGVAALASDARAPRGPRRRRPLVARSSARCSPEGSSCSAPPTAVLPRAHWEGSISAAASRRARAAPHEPRAGACARLGGRRGGARAGGSRPLAGGGPARRRRVCRGADRGPRRAGRRARRGSRPRPRSRRRGGLHRRRASSSSPPTTRPGDSGPRWPTVLRV